MLSVTRVVFVCILDQINDMHDVTTEEEGKRSDIASKLNKFIINKIMVDMDIQGGLVLLSEGSGGIGVGAINMISPASAILGLIELQSSSDAEKFIIKLNDIVNDDKSLGLSSIRILLCTDDCPCYEFTSFLSSSPFAIYLASPPNEEGDINIQS